MLKFQLPTSDDLKVAACIERKRQIEEARKSRIFNPRIRRIGIDKEFLDRQIEEKQRQRQLEQERECRMDEALVRSSQLAIMLEKREEEERRKIHKEINTFRQINQRVKDRREFDLYDPDQLKKSLPLCFDDDDPRIGPASAQKFQGEDIKQAERLKEQKEQMQSWLMQQMYERRQNKRQQQNADEFYQQTVISRDKRAIELEKMELECRRRLNETNAQFNRTLAEEQEYRRRCDAIKEEEDKQADIYNHVTGDFLTEAKEQAASSSGPNKLLGYRYKGMTDNELKAIYEEQAQQMLEIQKIKSEAKQHDVEWERLMQNNARAAELYHRDLDEKKKKIRIQIAEENLRLAQEQKSHRDNINRMPYRHTPTYEFFDKFNSSAR
ncbi:hypothetical protein PV327_004662 [Microctonus hyperodae]|uniref:RIB43A-like with coiled-coils protein 2 n=1 Tax=Microctonus hyperodae TaxID=165561 RepID=A0AA39FD62_MICHY|nr:hypothetical protein PV327_004662 [Microctonus hyperodae]